MVETDLSRTNSSDAGRRSVGTILVLPTERVGGEGGEEEIKIEKAGVGGVGVRREEQSEREGGGEGEEIKIEREKESWSGWCVVRREEEFKENKRERERGRG